MKKHLGDAIRSYWSLLDKYNETNDALKEAIRLLHRVRRYRDTPPSVGPAIDLFLSRHDKREEERNEQKRPQEGGAQ